LLTLLAFGAIVASAAWLAWWMLEPINRVAGVLRVTTRFLLTDVVGLMILLQVGLAIIGRALSGSEVSGEEYAMYWVLIATFGILIAVLWAASVSVVSRAGIQNALRRIVVMVLLVPGTLTVMVALPALIVISIVVVAEWFVLPTHQRPREVLLVLMPLGCLVLALAAFGLRRLSYWALADSTHELGLAPLESAARE